DSIELRKMYFSPSIRGRGWGRLMVQRMMAIERSRGYRRIELLTASVLTGAIGLYRSCGFVRMPGDASISRCDRAFERVL
ncbi:MAG: GNAT family N-acetyltransferase, partial [Gammaproteobacteria bacterium]|nr:GNAT family N-acetyltransferase [Gammaproteobacteria bacterium]